MPYQKALEPENLSRAVHPFSTASTNVDPGRGCPNDLSRSTRSFVVERTQPERRGASEAVRLGMALVGTTVAVALGLLIASAKGFYDSQNSEVTQLAADVVLLDKILNHYGPETEEIRDLPRSSVAHMVNVTQGRNSSDKKRFTLSAASETFIAGIGELSPENDGQRFLQSQAASAALKLAQTRVRRSLVRAVLLPALYSELWIHRRTDVADFAGTPHFGLEDGIARVRVPGSDGDAG